MLYTNLLTLPILVIMPLYYVLNICCFFMLFCTTLSFDIPTHSHALKSIAKACKKMPYELQRNILAEVTLHHIHHYIDCYSNQSITYCLDYILTKLLLFQIASYTQDNVTYWIPLLSDTQIIEVLQRLEQKYADVLPHEWVLPKTFLKKLNTIRTQPPLTEKDIFPYRPTPYTHYANVLKNASPLKVKIIHGIMYYSASTHSLERLHKIPRFSEMFEHIFGLAFTRYHLITIGPRTFERFKNLRTLILGDTGQELCTIQELKLDSFQSIPQVVYLCIRNTFIGAINPLALQKLSRLKQLELDNIQVTTSNVLYFLKNLPNSLYTSYLGYGVTVSNIVFSYPDKTKKELAAEYPKVNFQWSK